MKCHIGQSVIHYVEYGTGIPVIALHGAGVDHREIEAAVEAFFPHDGYRRIYPDLPAMGQSEAVHLNSNNDVVHVLCDFIERVADGSVLLLGHSYGAYLARGVAARRPDIIDGLALICPLGQHATEVPEPTVVWQDDDADDELDPEDRRGFQEYFVVRTRATARRYRDHVVPGMSRVDEAALGRIFADWPIDMGEGSFNKPSVIVAGRQDSTVGYIDALHLGQRYSKASIAVIDGAGHALLHEYPDLITAHIRHWLQRLNHAM
ncbi:alpha/beta fold hydrolase [Enteractinococcus helveticum]|uniref:Haloalkane dehalogenase n=1 Tax=Enteractinococcus helveticum TaxID=1837282 RepID=A0A1B7M1N0_9MICC|nr:alpha/beta hydrolase [Enteractinococcus helveticum]OAV62506.1 haloalkane dehalogenase [Enteractinococcus helveticum]